MLITLILNPAITVQSQYLTFWWILHWFILPSKEGRQLTHDVHHIIHGWALGRIFIPATTRAYIKRFMSVMKLKAKAYNFNPLAPNNVYIHRTAQLTSRRCIFNIYSTNILTEYFKHAAHSPFFSLQDAIYFIMLSLLVPVIFTF